MIEQKRLIHESRGGTKKNAVIMIKQKVKYFLNFISQMNYCALSN